LDVDEVKLAWLRGDTDFLARSVLPMVAKKCREVARRTGYTDVDELHSASYVRVAQQLATFNPDSAKLTTWIGYYLESYLQREVISRWTTVAGLPAWGDDEPFVVEDRSGLEAVELVRVSIEKLGDRDRVVLKHHLDGLSVRLIAKKLTVSGEQARLLLIRAKENLRKVIEKDIKERAA